MRAMTRMETTTYSESVSSTPNIGLSASTGPMQNGMTYIVRPRMHPRYSSVMTDFISAGSIQLLVGPASASSTEQMKVRSSTRATSLGSEAQRNEFGFGVEPGEGAGVDQLLGEPLPLLVAAVDPDDLVGGGQLGHLLHPGQQAGVGGGGVVETGSGHGSHASPSSGCRGGVLHRRCVRVDPVARTWCNETGSDQVTDVLDVCNRERCYV